MYKILSKLFEKITPKEFVKLIIVLEVSVSLFLASVVINNNDTVPGRGFESAKVNVIQVSSTIVIFTTFVFLAFALFNYSNNVQDLKTGFKKIFKSLGSILFIGLLSVSLIVSTRISPFLNIATQGNFFRFQGLSTYLPMILCCYILYRCINRKTFHIIAASIILSGIFQAFMAFTQIFSLFKNDPSKLTEGIWVNGYYGQANFFSGHLMIAIILASYYLSTKSLKFIKDKKQKLAVIFLCIVTLTILITAMILSYSEWGWVSLAASAIIIFSFELMPKKIFRLFIVVFTILVSAGSLFLISHFPRYELRIEIWQRIRDIFVTNINNGDYRYVVFGFGFDTLADVFKLFGNFPTLIIDRAHNIIFDILIQTGIAGIGFFVIVLGRLGLEFKKVTSNRLLFFITAAFMLFLFKSLVNEYSITNFFQWLILGACALKVLIIDEDDDPHLGSDEKPEIHVGSANS
ncbi:MAG: O-antigen ligase family protein [Candidatus Dojkabacteria bacterium]